MRFMYLYPNNTVQFDNNGYGPLSDCRSAKSSEELNGDFEIEFEYPADGSREIKIGDIVVALPRKGAGEHPFVIDKIERPYDGILSVHASHWSCLLSGVVIDAIEDTTAAAVIKKMHVAPPNGSMITAQWATFNTRASEDGAFPMPTNYIRMYLTDPPSGTININGSLTNIRTEKVFKAEGPTSFRALMGDEIEGGSLLNVFGGEYKYEPIQGNQAGTRIYLLEQRGVKKDIVIQYGYNMTDFQLDEDYSDVYTHIIPYYNNDGTYIKGPIVSTTKTYPFTKFMMVDVTSEFSNNSGNPTQEQLRAAGEKYFTENKIDEPDIDLKVQANVFEDLDLDVGDYITVSFPMYNYDAVLECKKIVADIINECVTEIEFTTVKKNIDTIVAQSSIATGGDISKSKKGNSSSASSSGGGGGGGATLYPSNAAPQMDGTASAGSSTLYSRGDHKHPSNVNKVSVGNVITNVEIDNIMNS